jgi:hypothetical protein
VFSHESLRSLGTRVASHFDIPITFLESINLENVKGCWLRL